MDLITHDDSFLEISVVMPCLNEAETLATCVRKARAGLETAGVRGEIIVADNGSTDGSAEIAEGLGARVVRVSEKGYGSALRGGIGAARGRYVVMGDADDSYDFSHLRGFIDKLREGYDLVMGNRFLGGIERGAMPALNRYLGNPVLSFIGRCFFKSPCGDFHCGLRAFPKASMDRLNLRSTGMEMASEMIVKATLSGMRIAEVPTTLSPDGRSRRPHLRPWRDGWRNLRVMLLFSPRWLFLYPGIAMVSFGTVASAFLLHGPKRVGPVSFDIHTLLYSAAVVPLGFQAILFAVALEERWLARLTRAFPLEWGVAAGLGFILSGIGLSALAVGSWSQASFGALDPHEVMRLVIPGAFLFTLGTQTVLASFLIGCLKK